MARRGVGLFLRAVVFFAGVSGAVAGGLGCNDGGVKGARGGLATTPSLLDFGPVALTQEARLDVSISNDGRAPFEVKSLVATVPGFSVEGMNDGGFTLMSGESQKVQVVFRPQAEGKITGGVQISTDALGQMLLAASGQGVKALLDLSPTALDFGSVELNSTQMDQVVLHNPTSLTLSLTLGLEGESAADFGSSLLGKQVVKAGQSLTVPLSYHPTQIGVSIAKLSVGLCDGCAPEAVALSGNGISPLVSVSPELLDFGRVTVGSKVEKKLTIANNGQEVVIFEPPDIENDTGLFSLTSVPSLPNNQLFPGQVVEVSVGFSPTQNQQAKGPYVRLSVRTPSKDGSVRIPLLGEGGFACVVVSPKTLDFGTVPDGMTVSGHVTLINRCNDSVSLGDLTIAQATGGYFSLPAPNATLIIPKGASAPVQVMFTSKSGSANATAQLDMTAYDGATSYPFSVPMVAAVRSFAPCAYALTPPSLNFAGVNLGAQVTLALGFQNLGADDCVISGFDLAAGSDPQFSTDTFDTVTVKPGTQYSFPVHFRPDAEGSFSALAEAFINKPGANRMTADLSGQGVTSCFALQPSTVDFGNKRLECGLRTRTVVGINNCSGPATLNGVYLSQGTSSEFSLVNAPAPGDFPLTVPSGSQINFQVNYQAVNEGTDSTALQVNVASVGVLTAGLVGAGELKDEFTDLFVQGSQSKVDVLFVMDNSGSMTQEQDSLGRNFAAFMKAAESGGIDYHIGVTTTGIETSPGGWSPCPGGAEGGEAGRLFPADNSSPRIITPTTLNREAVFQNNIHVGLCHWDEQGLEGAYRALSDPLVHSTDDPNTPLPNDGNAGFLRDDAKLAVIVISDEEDSSPQTVAFYETYFKSLKGNDTSRFEFSAIVAPADISTCPTASSSGNRYIQLAHDTGGVFESICTPDWATTLVNLSLNAFGPLRQFPLSQTPSDPGQIVVRVNGTSVTTGWTYDGALNMVIFNAPSAPAAGSEVEITYPLGC